MPFSKNSGPNPLSFRFWGVPYLVPLRCQAPPIGKFWLRPCLGCLFIFTEMLSSDRHFDLRLDLSAASENRTSAVIAMATRTLLLGVCVSLFVSGKSGSAHSKHLIYNFYQFRSRLEASRSIQTGGKWKCIRVTPNVHFFEILCSPHLFRCEMSR